MSIFTWLDKIHALETMSLEELVDASERPQVEPNASTRGTSQNGCGWQVNIDGSVQHFTEQASSVLSGATAGIDAADILLQGRVQTLASSAHHLPTLNGGMLNPQLAPPVDPLAGIQEGAWSAVKQVARDVQQGGIKAVLKSLKTKLAASLPRASAPQALIATAVDPQGAPLTDPYVVIPAHTHTVIGQSTVGTQWQTSSPLDTTAPVLGITCQPLYGPNRMMQLLQANRAAVIQRVLGS